MWKLGASDLAHAGGDGGRRVSNRSLPPLGGTSSKRGVRRLSRQDVHPGGSTAFKVAGIGRAPDGPRREPDRQRLSGDECQNHGAGELHRTARTAVVRAVPKASASRRWWASAGLEVLHRAARVGNAVIDANVDERPVLDLPERRAGFDIP